MQKENVGAGRSKLTFWYLVVNDHGMHSMLDFAAFYVRFTTTTIWSYAVMSVLAITVAQLFYRPRLART